jgi:hypothetical protein
MVELIEYLLSRLPDGLGHARRDVPLQIANAKKHDIPEKKGVGNVQLIRNALGRISLAAIPAQLWVAGNASLV